MKKLHTAKRWLRATAVASIFTCFFTAPLSAQTFNPPGAFEDTYPTAPSLTFGIFRKHFMPSNTIPITKGNVFDFISFGFTGGSTEMYIPSGKNLRCYDANSLYPSIMKSNYYGVGQIIQFVGDISILGEISPTIFLSILLPFFKWIGIL